jgi:hypothetical protein
VARIDAEPGSTSKEDRGARLGARPLDLRALGLLEDDGALNLTDVLCRLLVVADGAGKTWAQRLIEGWIVDALDGNHRAIEDILDRTEKGRLARAPAGDTIPPIDDETASKILEALCGRGDDATGD